MLRYITNLFVFLFVIYGTVVFAYDNGVVPVNTVDSARRMITDLVNTFGDKYSGGADYLKQLDAIEARIKANGDDETACAELDSLIRTASLANPLLDFDKILIVRRRPLGGDFGFVGLNSYTNDTVRRTGWDNELVVVSNLRGTPELKPFYRHANQAVIRDINLHFDGKRIIFSSINESGNWAIYEVDTDGKNPKELTPNDQKDVDWWDACYLPEEGYIVTGSTAGMQGLPCENGGRKMSNLYRVNTNNKTVRQLTFEQDSDWHPSVMHDGRVMYLRWEYSDIPHYMSR
ncbi:MAG: hypothetical protein LBU65_02570, partial [Planctomycetaceae bacterium]|nr:hypothetical protein [Planctomycetaceae bacterium]